MSGATSNQVPLSARSGELPRNQQRHNCLVFTVCQVMAFCAAPVSQVAVLHAPMIHSLGKSDTIANLPDAIVLCTLPFPVVLLWMWPTNRSLRPLLAVSYLVRAIADLGAGCLIAIAPQSYWSAALIAHAAIIGTTGGIVNMCLWELIGSGIGPKRRGRTMSVTFGFGPVFAIVASCLSQLALTGDFLGLVSTPKLPQPWGYVAIFAATGLIMGCAAFVSWIAYSDPPQHAFKRVTCSSVLADVRQFLGSRAIRIAITAFLLTSAGSSMVQSNLVLYTDDATGQPSGTFTGVQMALRFGCKSIFGFALGWMLARYRAKLPVVATTLVSLFTVGWALLVPGTWYLLCFGLLGAGELYFVYYFNYIVGCSPAERIRDNAAYTNVIVALVGLMPPFYGLISDHWGLRASFVVALGILLAAVWVTTWLPRSPTTSTSHGDGFTGAMS